MNANQANNLDLPDLLSRLGHQPVEIKKNGAELWYRSPFREEKDASFHISKGHTWPWVWNDFADQGGTVMDFVMRYQGHRSFKKALAFLEGLYQGKATFVASKRVGEASANQLALFSFHGQIAAQPPKIFEKEGSILEFIEASPIRTSTIHDYLTKKRGIPRSLADRYLQEVTYRHRNSGKRFFAFGVQNIGEGYEIRAASDDFAFKHSCLGNKNITLILGQSRAIGKVNLFEGMLDCLSLMVMLGSDHLKGDSIILNTVENSEKAFTYIREHGYTEIYSFLDNDAAGQKCTEQLVEAFGQKAKPQNSLFANHKDLNQALIDDLVLQLRDD